MNSPTFKLPDGFALPDGGTEDQFEALVTLRRLPNGQVALVAVDGIDLPGDTPSESVTPAEVAESEERPSDYQELPSDMDFADAIETRLSGVAPSEIRY